MSPASEGRALLTHERPRPKMTQNDGHKRPRPWPRLKLAAIDGVVSTCDYCPKSTSPRLQEVNFLSTSLTSGLWISRSDVDDKYMKWEGCFSTLKGQLLILLKDLSHFKQCLFSGWNFPVTGKLNRLMEYITTILLKFWNYLWLKVFITSLMACPV